MDVFVARQPIFDRNQNVYGYELLYRMGNNNVYETTDGDKATTDVIANSFITIGIDSLTDGKRAFINFTENLLKSELATILPPKKIAVEILETVRRGQDVISASKRLKQMGYMLVLDDCVCSVKDKGLLEIADIVKIDLLNTSVEQQKRITKNIGLQSIKFLAEKVETREAFEHATEMGYSYFQGYFFSKPVIISSKELPVYKMTYLQVLREINRPDMEFGRLDNLVKRDVSLAYKLLKFINSAAFGFRKRIDSIKQALVLLGIVEIKKWMSLIALRSLAEDKPDELMMSSVMRARMAELLADKLGLRNLSADFFLMGLLSMIDVIVGRPMAVLLVDLPLSNSIINALLGKSCKHKTVLDLVISYEKGLWEKVSLLAQELKIEETDLPALYIKSIEWANECLRK